MKLSDLQHQLLASADSDGRVFATWSQEVDQLVQEGYLERNTYSRDCYWVRKEPGGKNLKR